MSKQLNLENKTKTKSTEMDALTLNYLTLVSNSSILYLFFIWTLNSFYT